LFIDGKKNSESPVVPVNNPVPVATWSAHIFGVTSAVGPLTEPTSVVRVNPPQPSNPKLTVPTLVLPE
jgi:hypothetical protein